VRNKKAHEHPHHGHTGLTRHSLRNGFTAYFVLSPVTGLSCHRRSRGKIPANLTPASGRQDHTTSPSALVPFVSSTICVHRIPPHVDDVRNAPFLGQDGASRRFDLPDGESEIFLQMGLDSQFIDLPVGQISPLPSPHPSSSVASSFETALRASSG
jgi:hypothetical protein